MTHYELAFDEDGVPFAVPVQVVAWRPRRAGAGAGGRPGRPAVVHGRGPQKGKPLIVPVDASHDDLLAAAGPGRYRLEGIDEDGQAVEGVPIAWTGPLDYDDDEAGDVDKRPDLASRSPRAMSTEYVLCHVVTKQAQVFERAIGQLSAVMSSAAELLNASTSVITHRPPPPPAPPQPEASEESDEPEEEEEELDDSEEPEPAARETSKLSEITRFVVKETIDKVVALIFEKLTASGATHIGGIPLEALSDWRKAAPGYTSAADIASHTSAPNMPSHPSAPTTMPEVAVPGSSVASAPTPVDRAGDGSGSSWPPADVGYPAAGPPASAPSRADATPAAAMPTSAAPVAWGTMPTTASSSVMPSGVAPSTASPLTVAAAPMPAPVSPDGPGAALSQDPLLVAAPASAPAAVRSSVSDTAAMGSLPQGASAVLGHHLLQIWQGLTPSERSRASALVSRLSDDERAVWFAELAKRSVPDAIARARAVLHGPAKPPLP